MKQIHKRFTNEQVIALFQSYLNHEIEREYIQSVLGIGKSRFFFLIADYRSNPKGFSVAYRRKTPTRMIDSSIEKNIIKELSIDKQAIENKDIPLHHYNYSYIKNRLSTKYDQLVSLSTIIDRAKKNDFYLKRQKYKAHDREVLTRYVGELIQHDSSHHLWAPCAREKWYLITSIDDFSRYMLYAILLRHENVWAHILALQTIALKYGLPYSFYVDSHSIFRFVRGRDENHYEHHLSTDECDPQWKQVINDLGIKIIYALSPQAKGKAERPYGWLQDHLVRTCIRENIDNINDGNRILSHELRDYNHKRVHSTTGEIPYIRFQKAIRDKQSLFREFKFIPPIESPKDIFCLRFERVSDAYRKVSFNNALFKVNGVSPLQNVLLKIYPLNRDLCEIRFWSKNKLVDIQKVKFSEIKMSSFNSESVHF